MIFGTPIYHSRPWFAWRPVRLATGQWAWLQWVDRYRDGCAAWGFYFWTYHPYAPPPRDHEGKA